MEYLKYQQFGTDASGNPTYLATIAGKSSDSKPTAGLVSGSEFIEVNTGKTFVLDAISTSKAWHEKVVATAEVAST